MIDAETGGEGGTKRSGISELKRQLSERSGRDYSYGNVYNTTMLVFLSQEFLDMIESERTPKSYGYQVSRLYKTPELMHQVEQEVLDGALKSVAFLAASNALAAFFISVKGPLTDLPFRAADMTVTTVQSG